MAKALSAYSGGGYSSVSAGGTTPQNAPPDPARSGANLGKPTNKLGQVLNVPGEVAGGVVDTATAVPRFLSAITNLHNILRGLQIVAGAVLVLAGLYLLAKQIGLASEAEAAPAPLKSAANAVPSPEA